MIVPMKKVTVIILENRNANRQRGSKSRSATYLYRYIEK